MKRPLALSVLALLFGGYVTVAPTAATAAPAAAAPAGSLTVHTTALDVTTSTGQQLRLWVGASRGYLSVVLSKGDGETSYGEDHEWSFEPSPGFRFNRDTGHGTISATGSELHRYGRVELKLHQTRDWTQRDCSNSGSMATTRVHIKGSLFFRTRATGDQPWGNVGNSSEPLTIDTRGQLVAFDRCDDGAVAPTLPCEEDVFWGQRSLFGGSFTFDDIRQNMLGAVKFNTLPHTSHEGYRLDVYSVPVAAPVFTTTATGVQVDVTGSNDGRVTGSATLSADGAGTSDSMSCGSGSETMTVTDWDDATLANGADPLTLHPDLGSPLVAHEGTGATIQHSTPDPAPTV